MEFLRDPLWQFIIYMIVTLIVGIATVITSIWVYRKQYNRKEISYEIISNELMLSMRKEVEDRAAIQFDNKPIKNLRLVVMSIFNSGNVPIVPEDFKEPISISLGTNVDVLDAEVIETVPGNLKATLSRRSNSVDLEPLLLNRGSMVRLKILLAGVSDEIKVGSMIVGIQEVTIFHAVKRRTTASSPLRIILGFLGLLMLILLYGLTPWGISLTFNEVVPIFAIWMVTIIVAFVLIISGFLASVPFIWAILKFLFGIK